MRAARPGEVATPPSPSFADPVALVMRSRWAVTTPDAKLADAEQIMRLARIRELPVMSGDVLVGILHHRDVLHASVARLLAIGEPRVTRWDLLADLPVAAVMEARPATATADEPIRDVVLRMLRSGVASIPIVADGDNAPCMIGIAVESDLLRLAYPAPDARP